MKLFDSHAHYDDDRFDEDRDELLATMPSQSVLYIMNAASDINSAKAGIAIAEKYPFVYAAAGIHPHEAASAEEGDFDELVVLLKHPKVKALGEIGLDYYYDFSPREVQKEVFKKQLSIAAELDVPVIIHDRDAHADIMEILKQYPVRGVLHCFTGSVEMAKELLKMDFYIAFGGSLTFNNAVKPVEVAKFLPMDKILIETDCPYLTPVPFRGRRNHSGYVHYVAEKLASIKNLSVEEIAEITCENAKSLFAID